MDTAYLAYLLLFGGEDIVPFFIESFRVFFLCNISLFINKSFTSSFLNNNFKKFSYLTVQHIHYMKGNDERRNPCIVSNLRKPLYLATK